MRLKIISKFYDLKLLICIFVSLFILISWYLVSFEVAPYDDDSSRWIILKKIILTFNDGYYFQYGANVPMEIQWEDPGFAFWTVFYGMLKNIFINTNLNPYKDPYIIQFYITCLIIIFSLYKLRFSKFIFIIPIALSIFIYISEISEILLGYKFAYSGLIYLSFGMHWTKALSAILLFTYAITFFKNFYNHNVDYKTIIKETLIYGLLFGFLTTLRNDIFIPVQLSLFIFTFLIFLKYRKINMKDIIIKIIILFILFYMSAQIPKLIMSITWKVRDIVYSIDQSNDNSGHPKWHVLIISLGYVDNKYDIKWDDGSGWQVVKEIQKKDIKYGTKEHEKYAKKTFFFILKDDPTLIFRNIYKKTQTLLGDVKNKIVIYLTLSLMFGNLILRYLIQRKFLNDLLIFTYPTFFIVPLIIYPYSLYYIDLIAMSVLISLYSIISVLTLFKAE